MDAKPTPPIEARDYFMVMAHFYRGEVGRIMIWRQRLDTTTNWAIAAATAVITYGLSHAETTHLVFLFANIVCFFLLIVESRRYRYYDAFRARVRMLEAHFLMPAILMQPSSDTVNWREQLAEDMKLPSFKISRREALFRRFGRNYVWLFLIISLAWAIKIWAHCPDSHSFSGFLLAAQNGQPLPLWLFWFFIVVTFGTLLWMAFGAARLEVYNPESDISAREEREWQV
jgi:uncharacterized membrane protein